MVLSKEDIEAAIAQSQHQDEIRHSLSNYFEDLEKPVAVAIGIGHHKIGEGRFGPEFDTSGGEDRDAHPQNVDKVVNLLRKNGIDAVSFIDPKASSPDSFVVTETGVLCPFMTPKDSLKATIKIENLLLDNDFRLSGHVNPLAVENILYASKNSIDSQWQAGSDGAEHVLNLKSMHPNVEEFSDLEKNNGGDYKTFVERKVREAYAASTDVDLNQMDINNVYEEGMPHLYRGGTLGGNPYAVVSQFTSRKVAHSSPAISVCSNFSGKGKSFSSRGGAVYEKTSDNIEYGFIYKLKSLGDEQKYYRNVGLETGSNPKTKDETDLSEEIPWNGRTGDIYETPILPHHNPIESIYLYVGQWNEQKLFEIPMESGQVTDPEWRDFLKMHEPTDDKTLGYLATRQNLQKQQQTDNPLHAYEFVEKNNLEPDNQEYLNNVSAREFLSNFMHEGDIRDNTDNTISVTNTDFNLNGLKLSKLPDMSGVRIEGSFHLNNSTINSIEAKNLPMVSGGISMLGIEIKNAQEISAQHFLNIIGANQQSEWSRIDKICSLSLDAAPQGFELLKLYEMPSGLKVTYDTIEKIPETLKGISISGVKIKDQSSIENMQASDFIYKIKGNMGTHPLGYDIGVLQEQGVHHTQIHDGISLNLEHTNINTLPKDMRNLTVETVILNHETVITSLDNFPVTKRGIYDLNFNGDLKNETMESFLLKTKGTEWVANNTTKAEDGHLVITGDFNFTTQSWSNSIKHQMEITSFPKDIEKVEFKGAVEPQKMQQIKIYKDIMNNKKADTITLYNNKMKMDLSAHQSTDINIEGSLQDIILPQTISKISIADCKNCQIDKLKNIPENVDLSCYRVTNEQSFDISNLSINNLRLSQSSFSAISFPKTIKTLDIDNVELNKPIVLPEGMQEFSATTTKFPKESIIDLSSCKNVKLSNCTFDKNTKLDLSNCERVELQGVDLSNVDVILPKKGHVNIGEDVKFAPDFKLDLSNCEEGYVNPNVQCQEIKLPKKIVSDSFDVYKLPKITREISTSCIRDSRCKFEIPSHVKIVDEPDKNGKKISLKFLKYKGVSKKQISQIRKERIINSIKGLVHKIVPDKKKTGVSQTVSAQNSQTVNFSDDRLAALSGRNGASSKSVAKEEVNVVAPQTIEQTPIKQVQEPIKTEPIVSKTQEQKASVDVTTSSPKTTVSEMSSKEKISFFKSLRKGVNTLLSKVSTGKDRVGENQTTQQKETNIQSLMINNVSDKGR